METTAIKEILIIEIEYKELQYRHIRKHVHTIWASTSCVVQLQRQCYMISVFAYRKLLKFIMTFPKDIICT